MTGPQAAGRPEPTRRTRFLAGRRVARLARGPVGRAARHPGAGAYCALPTNPHAADCGCAEIGLLSRVTHAPGRHRRCPRSRWLARPQVRLPAGRRAAGRPPSNGGPGTQASAARAWRLLPLGTTELGLLYRYWGLLTACGPPVLGASDGQSQSHPARRAPPRQPARHAYPPRTAAAHRRLRHGASSRLAVITALRGTVTRCLSSPDSPGSAGWAQRRAPRRPPPWCPPLRQPLRRPPTGRRRRRHRRSAPAAAAPR